MGIFNFDIGNSIGEVRSVETSKITVRVTEAEKLQRARVGRLVAIQAQGDEWLVGLIEKVWRHPVEFIDSSNYEPLPEDYSNQVPTEENGFTVSLVGTYRERDGEDRNVFSRAVFALPDISRLVFPIEQKALEDFMGILSASNQIAGSLPLKIGTYTLDGKAAAYLDGNKLFQRHAALLGSTGSGKSYTVASILEQAAKLPNSNLVVFDLHGEYSSMEFATHYRIAGTGDLKHPSDKAIFLPFWLLNYEEMQSLFVDRSGDNAPNQALALLDSVTDLKRQTLTELKKQDLLDGFTVDAPIPFQLESLIRLLEAKNSEENETGEFYSTGEKKGQPKTKQGPLHGKLTRFIIRLKSKINDRRYGFMYQAPSAYDEYNSLEIIASKFMGFGKIESGKNSGIKIIDFSEVPSDILPVVVGLVARLIFQIQFWSDPGNDGDARHPIALVCDEAHLYLPNTTLPISPLERRALENFERIAKEGRKYGVGLMVISQRPSDVSTTILSQCGNIISLRLSNKTDQSVVKQLLPDSLESLMEILPTLDVGEAVIVGDSVLLPTRIKIAKPRYQPRSSTIPFWQRWSAPKQAIDLGRAVESLRLQFRKDKINE